jgi:hypothetical protein
MENKLSSSELLDKFLNSNPDSVKAFFDEFNSLEGEGPTVPQYFNSFESKYILK